MQNRSNRSVSYNNQTLTDLFKEFKDDVKENFAEIKIDLKGVKDSIVVLSNGQTLLGGTYKDLQRVCAERWEKFEELEKEIKEKKDFEDELKKSPGFYFIYRMKKYILTAIPWILTIAIVIFALITNNADLLREVLNKVHI